MVGAIHVRDYSFWQQAFIGLLLNYKGGGIMRAEISISFLHLLLESGNFINFSYFSQEMILW